MAEFPTSGRGRRGGFSSSNYEPLGQSNGGNRGGGTAGFGSDTNNGFATSNDFGNQDNSNAFGSESVSIGGGGRGRGRRGGFSTATATNESGFEETNKFQSFNESNNRGSNQSGFGSRGRRGGFSTGTTTNESVFDETNKFESSNHGGSSQSGFGGRGRRGGFSTGTTTNESGFGETNKFESSNHGGSSQSGFGGRGRRGGFSTGTTTNESGFGETNKFESFNESNNRGGSSQNGFSCRGRRGGFSNQLNSDAGLQSGFGSFDEKNEFGQSFNQGNTGQRGDFAGRGRRGGFTETTNNSFTAESESRGGFGGRGGRRGGGFGASSNFSNESNTTSFDNSFSQERSNARGGFSGRGRNTQENSFDQGESRNGFGGRGGFNQNNANFRAGFNNLNKEQNDADQINNEEIATDNIRTDLAPRGWVPQSRQIETLFSEDQNVGELYANVCDDDENVVVEELGGDFVKIERWEDADFPEQIMENLKRCRYVKPRRIQSVACPLILDGYDVKAQAETGSGKTAAFILPIIDSCMRQKSENSYASDLATPFALIIGPTRELVGQVYEQALKFAEGTCVSVARAYGQYNINANHREIRGGCDILCGTPGRLKQFITQGDVIVRNLRFLVLDEADQLLDVQFSTDILGIIGVPTFPSKEQRQTLLFSATFPKEVINFSNQFMKDNAVVITNRKNDANKRIVQDFKVVSLDKQMDNIKDMLKEEIEKAPGGKLRRTLIFTNTKRKADMLALYLCNHGIPASSINGDRGQNLREEALLQFRNGEVSVLASTDVCARGIDIKGLDHVINFEAPDDYKKYIHRIGRTGRIRQGYATTIVDNHYDKLLPEIAKHMEESGKEVPESLTEILKAANITNSAIGAVLQGAGGDAENGKDW